MQVRVHQDRGVEEDGEGQVEVVREDEEVKENDTCAWREDDRLNELEPMWCDTSVRHETQVTARCCAHSCRSRASCFVLVLVGVLCVTVDVLIGHDEVPVIVVIYVAIFVVIFCNWRCTLYTPVGDSELRWLLPKNHCKLCTKFFVRFMPQINRRFTDYHRFPRSISGKSIFVVRSHNRDATRKFAIATMRRNFCDQFS